jgi:hypothetical protein
MLLVCSRRRVTVAAIVVAIELAGVLEQRELIPFGIVGVIFIGGFAWLWKIWRWRLRVDDQGVASRRLVGWAVWTWHDFASGRIRKAESYRLVDPDRNRELNLGVLRENDHREVLATINAYCLDLTGGLGIGAAPSHCRRSWR